MISIVEDYIINNNCIITSAPNNGATSLTLFIANCLECNNVDILYYNPTGEIDRNFVSKYYKNVFNNVMFMSGPIKKFIDYLTFIDYEIDYLIIDPADYLIMDKTTIPKIKSLISGKLICTSQIRQDPNLGWGVYSTLERLYLGASFKYSIWLRNVSEKNLVFKTRYVDVFERIKSGNNFIARYVAKFSTEGGGIVG